MQQQIEYILNMENFPLVNSQQYVLMRASALTGHVLDEKLDLVLSDNQKVYTVYDSKESAIESAENLVKTQKNIECVIYNSNKDVAMFINAKE